jgi:ABC-type enterochelin transport system permease subunit
MLWFLGLISVIFGGVIAYIAEHYPPRIELLQTVGGLLLIAGFGLVGWSWPTIV